MAEITLAQLTAGTVTGEGVFDILMQTTKAHLESEFNKNRIKGTEYATVYLGSLEATLNTAVNFLLQRQKMGLEADLLTQQIANAVIEGQVLTAQKCKLQAEFDLIQAQTLKTTAENVLLVQKTATEKAQVLGLGVDDNSVIGKQKALYQAQTDGFARDSEQKAAKVLVDTWNARRMTDEATVADGTNMLNDVAIGRAINKLLAGVNA